MRFVIAFLIALVVALPASADEPQDVISNQIEAFQADDFATAFTFASPNIKRIFGSSERFGQMVRQGYPMVWRPAEVEFLDQRRMGSRVLQDVLIRDQEGVFHGLRYELIQTENSWQINGVEFIQPPQLSA